MFDRLRSALGLPSNNISGLLYDVFSKQWAQQQTIDPDAPTSAEAIAGTVPRVVVPMCFRAGFCLCGPIGRLRQRAEKGFIAALKKFCPPQSERRTRLSRGEVVILLVGQAKPDDVDELARTHGDGLLQSEPVSSVWLHIGAHSLSPWRSSFHEFKWCGGRASENVAPKAARLKATKVCRSHWEQVRRLDLGLRWVLVAYDVKWPASPVGTFVPNEIDLVEAMESVGEQAGCKFFWNPWPALRKRTHPQPKAQASNLGQCRCEGVRRR